jgi:hypothetical protein
MTDIPANMGWITISFLFVVYTLQACMAYAMRARASV